MDLRELRLPAGRPQAPASLLPRSPAARNLPALVMPSPLRAEQAWAELPQGSPDGAATPTRERPYSPHSLALRALHARPQRGESPRPGTPRPHTPGRDGAGGFGDTYAGSYADSAAASEPGSPRTRVLYPARPAPVGAEGHDLDDSDSESDQESLRLPSRPGTPRRSATFQLGAPRSRPSPSRGPSYGAPFGPAASAASLAAASAPPPRVPTPSLPASPSTPIALAPLGSTRSLTASEAPASEAGARAQLLRNPSVTLLGPNLRRRSWVPPGLLAVMVLTKLPLMYGVMFATAGVESGNNVKKGLGIAAIAVALSAYLGATGVGLYDVYKMRPGIERDTRLRFLGGRNETLALGAFGLVSPFILCGAEIMYAQAHLAGHEKKMALSLLPAIIGSAGSIVVCSRLFTFMQLRRGWAPVLQRPKLVEPITDLALTAMLIFGVTNGEKGFDRTSRQLAVVVPGLCAILGMSLNKSLLTYTALQNRLSDDTPQPWEVASEWL